MKKTENLIKSGFNKDLSYYIEFPNDLMILFYPAFLGLMFIVGLVTFPFNLAIFTYNKINKKQ